MRLSRYKGAKRSLLWEALWLDYQADPYAKAILLKLAEDLGEKEVIEDNEWKEITRTSKNGTSEETTYDFYVPFDHANASADRAAEDTSEYEKRWGYWYD